MCLLIDWFTTWIFKLQYQGGFRDLIFVFWWTFQKWVERIGLDACFKSIMNTSCQWASKRNLDMLCLKNGSCILETSLEFPSVVWQNPSRGQKYPSICFLCNMEDESTPHLFMRYSFKDTFWKELIKLGSPVYSGRGGMHLRIGKINRTMCSTVAHHIGGSYELHWQRLFGIYRRKKAQRFKINEGSSHWYLSQFQGGKI